MTIPELSPYITSHRYGQPKEIFKAAARKLRELVPAGAPCRLADLGCANGEFLHFLGQQFPEWELHGYDREPAFIRVAREAQPQVAFEVSDLFDIGERFDVVTMLGTFCIFADPGPVLEKLTSLAPVLLIDGYFNASEIDVRISYRDNSKPEATGHWRADFHQHAQSTVRALLEPQRQVEFEPITMGVDLPRNPDAPHINAWTFKDEHGRRHLTNGLNMILDDTLLVVTPGADNDGAAAGGRRSAPGR